MTIAELAGFSKICQRNSVPLPIGRITIIGKVMIRYAGSIIKPDYASIQAVDESGKQLGGAYTIYDFNSEYSLSYPYYCDKKATCIHKLIFTAGNNDKKVCFEPKERDLPPLTPPHKSQYVFHEIDETLDPIPCVSPSPTASPSVTAGSTRTKTPSPGRTKTATPASISSVIQDPNPN
jgi:hypothetical protein